MKRIFFLACLMAAIAGHAQKKTDYPVVVDDGMLSKTLSANTDKQAVLKFAQEFNTGFNKSNGLSFSSVNDAINYLGFDPRNLNLEGLLYPANEQGKEPALSAAFVHKLIDIRSGIGSRYVEMLQLRGALKDLALENKLTKMEAEYLSMFDLALQSIGNSFDLNRANQRLPYWAICTFGVVGSALGGGLAGAGAGAAVGGAIGSIPGAILGGVIGGLAGVVSGTLIGAATFC